MAEAEATEQKDQKAEEQKEDKNKPPPAPLILEVELHCSGCIKKIRRCVLKTRGVEEVEIDAAQNQVKIKGVVSPQEVCDIISKKTKRRTKVISPPPTSEAEPLPQLVISQVSGLTSVELNTFLHCEECAHQLNRRILKMRGVQTAATDFSSGKVSVTGTMDPNKLVEYVYKHTKKQAQIIAKPDPQPKPEPEPEPKPEPEPEQQQEEKGAAAADNADSKNAPEPEQDGAVKGGQEKPQEEVKKEESGGAINGDVEKGNKDDNASKEEAVEQPKQEPGDEDEKKMMIMPQQTQPVMPHQIQQVMPHQIQQVMPPIPYYYYYHPIYVIERVPPPYPSPMFFSDENPNACCIS